MSETLFFDTDGLPDPVCDYCGIVIEETGQQCPALDGGVCSP